MGLAERKTILVVDDAAETIAVLDEILNPYYRVTVARDGEKAMAICRSAMPPDLILLDILMPDPDGYEVCRQLKADPKTEPIPIIFVTAKDEIEDEARGLELGAVDYIVKPIQPSIVLARVRNHLELRAARDRLRQQNEELERKVAERTRALTVTQDVTIISLATLAETRDRESGNHIWRTQNYIQALSRSLPKRAGYGLALTESDIEMIFKSAPLHDIGKVGVPDAILQKPGTLTPEEFNIMKTHTTIGYQAILKAERILGTTSFLRFAREIVYTHHEKWDGSGYPRGLSGEDIPLSGRLMAVADVYDALISKRVYKDPFPHSMAVEQILSSAGSHFDPLIVDCFRGLREEFRSIALASVELDSEKKALRE